MITVLAAAHNCNGSGLCKSGNTGLGLAVVCLIIYLIVRKKK
jgi:hypothetical protein